MWDAYCAMEKIFLWTRVHCVLYNADCRLHIAHCVKLYRCAFLCWQRRLRQHNAVGNNLFSAGRQHCPSLPAGPTMLSSISISETCAIWNVYFALEKLCCAQCAVAQHKWCYTTRKQRPATMLARPTWKQTSSQNCGFSRSIILNFHCIHIQTKTFSKHSNK